MREIKYSIAREQAVCISARDADRLLDRRDGTAALLYLYLLRRGGSFVLAEAAKRLGVPEQEVRRAAEALESMGLLEIGRLPAPAEELPEYTSGEIQARTMDSPEFSALVQEVQRLYGRVLSGTDVKLLFGIYDYLALPPEVIMMLVSHCIERTRRRLGPGRLPTMRSVEREAYEWANREIVTLDMAEAHLRALARAESEMARARAAVGIRDRELSATERKYVESWLALGFDADCIAIAYDRTVLKTGRLHWKYMNSIIMSWHAKGLHTPQEIQRSDAPPSAGAGQRAPGKRPAAPDAGELERMERILDKVKNG